MIREIDATLGGGFFSRVGRATTGVSLDQLDTVLNGITGGNPDVRSWPLGTVDAIISQYKTDPFPIVAGVRIPAAGALATDPLQGHCILILSAPADRAGSFRIVDPNPFWRGNTIDVSVPVLEKYLWGGAGNPLVPFKP
jgi:hypothetical protein